MGVLAMPLDARIGQKSPSDLTVILDFKGPRSPASVKEMEREPALVLKSSGVRLAWHTLGEDPSAKYSDLVVMTFRGSCQYDPAPPRYDESGPLALTRITDGEILPFGEVDCALGGELGPIRYVPRRFRPRGSTGGPRNGTRGSARAGSHAD